jgi:hypothetical protein
MPTGRPRQTASGGRIPGRLAERRTHDYSRRIGRHSRGTALSIPSTRPVSRPIFGRRSPEPRADRAILFSWILGYLGTLLIGHHLTSTRPLVDAWALPIAACAGSLVTAGLAALAMKQTGSWVALPRLLFMLLVLAGLAWWSCWRAGTSLGPVSVEAFLADSPTADSGPNWDGKCVLDWDDDVPAWCIALAGEPDGAQRSARVEALRAALRPLYEAGAFIPHDTQAAAADAGGLSPDVATSLLTSPRGLEEDEPAPTPEEAARAWLRALPRKNPGDGHQYAMGRAVQVVVPELDGLAAGVEAALPGDLSAPGTGGAVSDLRNVLALAESLGLRNSVASLRERIAPTLQGAWVDDRPFSRRSAGFDCYPDKGQGIADALETHAAIELMAVYGVPPGIDLGALAAGLEERSTDARWNDESERVIAAMDGAFMRATWPDASRRHVQASDALLLAFVALIAWSVRNIQAQPLTMPDVVD